MEIPYPIMKNVSIGVAGVNVNAISTYYNPGGVTENESLRKYRWYAAGNGKGAPDVTNDRRIDELDDMASWSKTTFASLIATDTWFRVDIECTDIGGLTFGAASGCVYYKVN